MYTLALGSPVIHMMICSLFVPHSYCHGCCLLAIHLTALLWHPMVLAKGWLFLKFRAQYKATLFYLILFGSCCHGCCLLAIHLTALLWRPMVIPTNHPAFSLIIEQKYCLSHQKITKSLFFGSNLWCIMPIHFGWTHSIFKQIGHILQAKLYLQAGRYAWYLQNDDYRVAGNFRTAQNFAVVCA